MQFTNYSIFFQSIGYETSALMSGNNLVNLSRSFENGFIHTAARDEQGGTTKGIKEKM